MLLNDISWAIKVSEETHAAAACVHKKHKGYGENTLLVRSFLLILKPMITQQPVDLVIKRAQRRLAILENQRPGRANAQGLFMRDLFTLAEEVANKSGKDIQEVRDSLMQQKGELFDALTAEERDAYVDETAEHIAKRKRNRELMITKDELIANKRRKVVQDARDRTGRQLITACKISPDQIHDLATKIENAANVYGMRKNIGDRRKAAMERPDVQTHRDELAVVAHYKDARVSSILPKHVKLWVKPICLNRRFFNRTILMVVNGECERFYKFDFAYEIPCAAQFTELRRFALPELTSNTMFTRLQMAEAERRYHEYEFYVDDYKFTREVNMPITASSELLVLPMIGVSAMGMLFADASLIPIQQYVSGLPFFESSGDESEDMNQITFHHMGYYSKIINH